MSYSDPIPPPEKIPIEISKIPNAPGVYLMKDASSQVLYVGKAKSLKNRLQAYLNPQKDSRYQIRFLMQKVATVETFVTNNEKEAFLVEDSLIKKHRPRYNIFFKDDKTYLSLKLTAHRFPRLIATRKIEKDGSEYFGPYPSGTEAREVLELLETRFRLRNCSDHDFANRSRPCLQQQIGRCDAPCVGWISEQKYQEQVEAAKLFLEGKSQILIDELKRKMNEAAEALHFEEAARLRDHIQAIQKTLEKQKVVSHAENDFDAVGIASSQNQICVSVLEFRLGRWIEKKNYFFGYPEESPQQTSELIESFLFQYYSKKDAKLIPSEILLNQEIENRAGLGQLLTELTGKKIEIRVPQRGEKIALTKLAEKNASEGLRLHLAKELETDEILKLLKEKLNLRAIPKRIECYDISNLQDQYAVGAQVYFLNGKPKKDRYRRFKIKTVEGQNDFAMHYETLCRRLSHAEWELPDLIIIDGGKGQLSSAEAALKDSGFLEKVDLIALAKERSSKPEHQTKNKFEQSDEKSSAVNSKPERVFLPNRKDPIILAKQSPALHLLMQIRDEAHRFGIEYHRHLRQKGFIDSALIKRSSKKTRVKNL